MVLDTQKWSRDNSHLLSVIAFIGMVFILPNGMNLREQRLISFELIALFLLAVMIFRIHKPLGVFVGYIAISAPFHQAVDVNVMLAFLSFGLLYILSTNVEKPELLYNIICVSAILCVFWQVLQYFNIWVLMASESSKSYVGLLSNTNETSAFLAVSLPCFFRKGWKWTLWIPLLGLYLGISIGGTVAAYFAGTIYLLLNYKQLGIRKAVLLFVLISVMLFGYIDHKAPKVEYSENKYGVLTETHLNNRGRYWTEMAPIAAMKPFGWGLGQFKYVMPLIQTPTHLKPEHRIALWQNIGDKKSFDKAIEIASKGDVDSLLKKRWDVIWLEAHNEYMEIWFMSGLFGLLMALYAVYHTLMMPSPLIPKYGFLIACISAIWFFSFQIAPIAIITILYMGGIHAQNNSMLYDGLAFPVSLLFRNLSC